MLAAFACVALLLGAVGIYGVTFAAVTGVLGVVAAAACYIPARRVLRIDPADALRTDA
jgi:ABC-type lipoprotein release transport system permease subunit